MTEIKSTKSQFQTQNRANPKGVRHNAYKVFDIMPQQKNTDFPVKLNLELEKEFYPVSTTTCIASHDLQKRIEPQTQKQSQFSEDKNKGTHSTE